MLCSSVGRPKRPDLRDVRRAQPRHPALALDRLDHRRLFAADVGAGAAAQMQARQRARRIRLELRDRLLEDRAARGVLVAQIDVDVVDAHRPRGDQRAFEEPVRIALEVVAVLERAGLALVDVDGHEARRGLGADDPPLAPRRKAGAAQAAQSRILERRDHGLDVALAGDARSEHAIAVVPAIRGEVDVRGNRRARLARRPRRPQSLPPSRGRPDCARRPPPARARSGRCTARRSRARPGRMPSRRRRAARRRRPAGTTASRTRAP